MFRQFKNSFMFETLLPNDDEEALKKAKYKRVFSEDITHNLSTVSALYIYTGTPPHGYGTQAPKVAETVARGSEYNRRPTERVENIGGIDIQLLSWRKKDGKFPHQEIHGNYITSVMKEMCIKMLATHHAQIDATVEKIMTEVANSSSDILTKGRQTFCPLLQQSVTAAQAYENAFNFLEENTGRDCFGMLDWITAIFECFEKEKLVANASTQEEVEIKVLDPETKQRLVKRKKIQKLNRVVIEGSDNVRKFMQKLCCRFASYIKHKERGKKDRRAIASATMFLRPFLHIIELFHLELSKNLPGSTISIGGEEKKAKITSNMEVTVLETIQATHISQGTEDATKWNECLSPAIFFLMHHYFFSEGIRRGIGIKKASKLGTLFKKICKYGHLFQAWKEIQLGPGVLVSNEKHYSRLEWSDECQEMMNEKTYNWYQSIKNYITEDRKYVKSSPGMLMGMLNAASTTIGLLPSNFNMRKNVMKTICMRSSDDSTTKYLSDSAENNKLCITRNRQNLSLIGINLSPDKTFFLPEGIAEYTSWYIDGKFVSQYGTEVPSIRPQGKNPYDDLYAISKGTSTALQTLTINHLGATARIRLGISSCKRVWRLPETGTNIRENISLRVQLIEDGGENLWNCANCHLNEIALKSRYIGNESEQEYIDRILNPDNPFSGDVEEEMTYSKEHGCLMLTPVDTPNCIFRYMKRSNRTFRGENKKIQAAKEKANGAVYKLLNLADPTISLDFPSQSVTIKDHLISIIETMKCNTQLTELEMLEVNKAIDVLKTGKHVQEEKGDFWDDDDFE